MQHALWAHVRVQVDYVDYITSFEKLYDIECKQKNATYKK